jgi:hypothetical protein
MVISAERRSSRMLGRPLLFLSSYAPLFGLLAIRFQPRWLWVSCTVLAVLGVAALCLLLKLNARAAPGPYQLASVSDDGAEAASYLAAYLLPFLTVATPSARDVVAYAGFLIISAAIYLRSSLIQANPLLYLLGYKVLSIVDSNGVHAYVITRQAMRAGGNLQATKFKDDVLVDRS